MKENEFKCEMCKGVFEKGWSNEEAIEERDRLWKPQESYSVICDDCFNKINPVNNEELARKHGYKL